MFRKSLTLLMAVLYLVIGSAALTACNTVEGAGKDIESGGRAMKDEANEHK